LHDRPSPAPGLGLQVAEHDGHLIAIPVTPAPRQQAEQQGEK
jgi:hypothetical protein